MQYTQHFFTFIHHATVYQNHKTDQMVQFFNTITTDPQFTSGYQPHNTMGFKYFNIGR